MNVFIVYYHPEEKSFNHAMFQRACETLKRESADLKTSDLKAMKFDPMPGRSAYKTVKDPTCFKQQIEELHATEQNSFADFIEEEIRKMEWCDLMIWQFPMWWFGLPSVLKGWTERVFALGRVYNGAHLYENGLFKDKRAMLSFTTGAPADAYKEGGLNGDIHKIILPIRRGIEFLGFSVLEPNIVFAPAHISEEARKKALDDYSVRIGELLKTVPAVSSKNLPCKENG
ncbi:MAG: General stress protein 14 [Lentisphaerae bacterium ADurb.Bin242]|nr:MAG: General stress protein 14 [Lentisphaerae bacterium ADurb.Bin242]